MESVFTSLFGGLLWLAEGTSVIYHLVISLLPLTRASPPQLYAQAEKGSLKILVPAFLRLP